MKRSAIFTTVFSSIAASILAMGSVFAAPIYQSNFNSYTSANGVSSQAGTGLIINAFGSVAGWTASGTNVIHGVQRSSGDWAVMLYDTNAVTMSTGVLANSIGSRYSVAFDGAGGSYNAASQATGAGDTLLFEIINSVNAVVASYVYTPAVFTNSNPFIAANFSYAGNGTGAVRLRVSDTLADNRFGGAFDNLSITEVPEPASALLMLAGVAGLAAARRKRAAAKA